LGLKLALVHERLQARKVVLLVVIALKGFLPIARFFSLPKPTGRACSDGRGGDEQMVGKGIEVKAPVKAISESGQVADPVLGEVERMIGAAETGFKVTQDRVEPTD